DPSTVAQARKLRPDHVLGNTAPACRGVEPAIGSRLNTRRIADDSGDALDAVSHHLRVLDKIRQTVDDAGDQELIILKGVLCETAKLVSVTWIGKGEHEPAHICLLQRRQNVFERNIAVVW